MSFFPISFKWKSTPSRFLALYWSFRTAKCIPKSEKLVLSTAISWTSFWIYPSDGAHCFSGNHWGWRGVAVLWLRQAVSCMGIWSTANRRSSLSLFQLEWKQSLLWGRTVANSILAFIMWYFCLEAFILSICKPISLRLKESKELWWHIQVPSLTFLLQGQLFLDLLLAMLHLLLASLLQMVDENTLCC